ncbi:hypothetical protein KOI35_01690 [Actinoplanes bogorensis]|uniref:Uncharacterized protein n=1 Tax=Paractinoplanes bogorensis TaxID=1610840 RepID=A0ABS5YGU4_9ACTN|nr:hypothetical protein [Actinoplanes bogorensis]MBU2662211.1 hypothetical protein [Actinoplanes bogorensis]
MVLEGHFQWWLYGVGHSQLVLHAPADGIATSVHFEGVRAVKLRTSYVGLTILEASGDDRIRMLAYAKVPERLSDTHICLTLPTEDDGFVVCGRATALSGRQARAHSGWRWPEEAAVLASWSR